MDSIANLIAAMLRLSAPLIMVAMAGVLSYQVGLINIALEGLMLVGAFVAVVIAFATGSSLTGVLLAVAAGMILAALFALFVVQLRANLIVAGLAINFLALGGTAYLLQVLFDTSGTFAPPDLQTLGHLDIPFLQDIPIVGTALLGLPILVYVSWLTIPLVAVLLYRTTLGTHIRAVGENAEAAKAAGISVKRMQFTALILGGALCGLAGAHLAMGDLGLFRENMTNGRGFIALAAVYFAAARPGLAALACLLFGLFDALQFRLQTTSNIPPQFFQMLPYLIVVGALVLISARKEWRKGW